VRQTGSKPALIYALWKRSAQDNAVPYFEAVPEFDYLKEGGVHQACQQVGEFLAARS
jgi:hypothetical protein